MDLRTLIRLSPLSPRQKLALTRAVPRLSLVQTEQLVDVLQEQPRELARFLAALRADSALTEQAKIAYAIHELDKKARRSAESLDRAAELASIEKELERF